MANRGAARQCQFVSSTIFGRRKIHSCVDALLAVKSVAMNWTSPLALGALILAAVSLTSCDRKASEAHTPPPPEVEVTTVQSGEFVQYREYVGTLDGNQNAQIQARVAGYLASINYNEGDFVEEGTVLFEIDKRPFEAALAQAQAQLAEAEAKAELADITLARQTELYNQEVISLAEFQTATQDTQAARAAKQAAQAQVENAKLNLEFCTITAPFDGIVGRAKGQVGDLVGAGANMVLTTMSQVDPIRLYFPISEQEYLVAREKFNRLAAQPLEERPQGVELMLSDGSTFPHKGRFLFADRSVEQATGAVQIAAIFDNPGNVLRPGAFGKAKMPVRRIDNALLIPQQAVSDLQGQQQVTVVDENNTVKMVNVTTGPTQGQDVVIEDGLKAGDTIVVSGLQRVRSGVKVNPKPWQPPAAHADASPSPSPTPEPGPSPTPDESDAPATPTPSPEATPSPEEAGGNGN